MSLNPAFSSWSHGPGADRRRFLEEITPGNLRRLFWVAAIFLPISLAGWVYNLIFVHAEEVTPWIYFDLGMEVFFLVAARFLLRRPGGLPVRLWLVRFYYAYCLISMTGYFFSLMPQTGNNPYYALGLLLPALVFRLPFLDFFLLLGGTHILYLVTLWMMPDLVSEVRGASVFLGTDSLILAIIAAWILFAKDWQAFLRNRELELTNEKLQKTTEHLNEVMMLAAHDLKGPLHNIRSLFDLLSRNPAWQRDPYKEVVLECRKTCADVAGLVDDFLETHEIEHGAKYIHLQPVEMPRLLGSVIARNNATATVKGIRIVTTGPETAEPWRTDPTVCFRILDNLLSNATKYSPPGATVRITWEQSASLCRIDIGDSGPGISEEQQHRLFEKFHRTGNLPTAGEPSTGLGLFIVARLTKLLNGSISHFPNPEGGTIFRLELHSSEPG